MIRYALRTLRKTPSFTAGAMLTVALTVGATTAIFSVVYGVLLRQLPYRDVGRVFWMWSDQPGRDRTPFNVPDFLDYRESAVTVSGLAGYFAYSANLSDEAAAERVQGLRATGNFFDVLGAHARLGRLLERNDERAGFEHVVVLSQPFWIRRFGADPQVLGEGLRLNGETYTVVGVLATGFTTPVRDVDFVVPFVAEADARRNVRNSLNFIHGVLRLRNDVAPAQAAGELNAIARRLQSAFPVENARKRGVRLVAVIDGVVGPVRTALLTMFAAVAAVLLAACANLANLMLTRASGRRKDVAVQLALGAPRATVTRQVLVEALLIAAGGGLAGVLLAQWGIVALVAVAPAELPRVDEIGVDVTVLLFSLGLASFTGMLFGVVPAFMSARVDVRDALQGSGRGTTSGGQRVRGLLVSAEVALAVVLLVVMTMLAKSFSNVQHVSPGFEPSHALSARITLPANRYDSRDAIVTYQRALEQRLAPLSTVTHVGAVSLLPLSGLLSRVPFTVDGRPVERERVPLAQFRIVSPGYFAAARIPVTRGRGFSDRDTGTASPVAVVNEELVRAWLGGADPVGSRLLIDDNNTGPRPVDIVGVVANVQQVSLEGGPTWDLYLPYAQIHRDGVGLAAANMFWVTRTTGEPMNLASSFSREVRRLDPEVVASQIQPMGRYLSDAMAPRRFSLFLLAAFAAAAVALAMTGIYAVILYSVNQRRREIAIRLALGATERSIVGLIIGEGMPFIAIGVAVGLALAFAAARLVTTMLFGVATGDVATFAEVIAGVWLLALSASALPAVKTHKSLRVVLNAE